VLDAGGYDTVPGGLRNRPEAESTRRTAQRSCSGTLIGAHAITLESCGRRGARRRRGRPRRSACTSSVESSLDSCRAPGRPGRTDAAQPMPPRHRMAVKSVQPGHGQRDRARREAATHAARPACIPGAGVSRASRATVRRRYIRMRGPQNVQ